MSDENENENENERVAGPQLTRSKMLPVDGVVYCLFHTAVHEDTTDPYDSGQDECEKHEHRPVYYRGRKGDIDEVMEARFVAGEPQHGESKRVDEIGEGSVIIDNLSEVQEQMIRRVIARSAEPLSAEERALVVKMLTRAYTRTAAAYDELRDLAGHGDLTATEKLLELMHSALAKLGAENIGE